MPRRSPGEGSVFQRGDGRWVVQIELEDGKRKTSYVKSKKEGREKLKQLQPCDLAKGVPVREIPPRSYVCQNVASPTEGEEYLVWGW